MNRDPRIRACVLALSFLLGAATTGADAARGKAATPAPAPQSRAVPDEDEAAPGEGREIFIARCTACHSVDYVAMHARFGTRALWEMEVAKMRNAFKAPLSDDEARRIVDYLARAYGPADAPSAHDRQ
jgi:cytochrome c5